MRRLTACLSIALLAAACSSSPKPEPTDSPAPEFPVAGDAASLEVLDGRWEGEYVNETNGRTGTIVMEFSGKQTRGHGDVLWIPKGSSEPLKPSRPPTEQETVDQMPRIVSIRFVNTAGGTLNGTLDPFIDPECDCERTATFMGSVTGGVLQGRFTVTGSQPGVTVGQGSWKAKKVARRAE